METKRRLEVAGGALVLAISLHAQAQRPADQAVGGVPSSAEAQDQKSRYKAAQAADCALVRKVMYALTRDGGIDTIQVYVTTHDGAVILMGAVPQISQAERAVQVAKRVPGVRTVRNVLTLRMEA